MEPKKIYDDIVVMFFNLIRNEKLRTNIVLNLEYQEKVKSLIGDMLALEHDHECTFKDEKWSQSFAKAIVNITKEKIKFEKPDGKSLTDIYADYAEILTYSLNIFEISKEILMNSSIEITQEEIKLNSKVTSQMKEQFQLATSTNNIEVEVVDQHKEKPNNQNQNTGFNKGQGFAFNQADIPVPPFQNPRFYQFKTKPKYMKHLKFAFGIVFGLLTLVFISLEVVIISNTISIPTNNTYFESWGFLGSSKPEYIGVSIMTLYTGSGGISQSSIFLLILAGILGVYISASSFLKPRVYRDQFYFPYMILLSAAMFAILCGSKFLFNGSIWKAMTGNGEYLKNLSTYFELLFKSKNVTLNASFSTDVEAIYNAFVNNSFNSTLITSFLWIEAIIFFLTAAIIIAILVVNPKVDRTKIIRANEEYQKAIGELMQGRNYEMDQSLFEDKDEIDEFYRNLRNKQSESEQK